MSILQSINHGDTSVQNYLLYLVILSKLIRRFKAANWIVTTPWKEKGNIVSAYGINKWKSAATQEDGLYKEVIFQIGFNINL